MPRSLDYAKARELAVRAQVDPRTILAVFRGDTVRGMAGRRARRVLVDAGYLPATEPPLPDAA